MNWKYLILILYLGFVGLIMALVVFSSRQKVDLVSKDYYDQEIKYQDKIDALKNTKEKPGQVSFKTDDGNVVIYYDPQSLGKDFSGEITFFRPSDEKNDLKLRMEPDADDMQIISEKKLHPGFYKLQFSWVSGGKKYFSENSIYVK